MTVFVTGGTGYLGSRLILALLARGHDVSAVVRPGSEKKLPAGCTAVTGNALEGSTYRQGVPTGCVFVQLVGVAHPSPAKARQFVEIDERSAKEAVAVAGVAGVKHFVYVSVAHPAPAMHAYIEVRMRCEQAIRDSGLHAAILRPWYVLGPGHWWPYLLIPFYGLASLIPATREGAQRLGLVTVNQMVAALVAAVERDVRGVEVFDVPAIRSGLGGQ